MLREETNIQFSEFGVELLAEDGNTEYPTRESCHNRGGIFRTVFFPENRLALVVDGSDGCSKLLASDEQRSVPLLDAAFAQIQGAPRLFRVIEQLPSTVALVSYQHQLLDVWVHSFSDCGSYRRLLNASQSRSPTIESLGSWVKTFVGNSGGPIGQTIVLSKWLLRQMRDTGSLLCYPEPGKLINPLSPQRCSFGRWTGTLGHFHLHEPEVLTPEVGGDSLAVLTSSLSLPLYRYYRVRSSSLLLSPPLSSSIEGGYPATYWG